VRAVASALAAGAPLVDLVVDADGVDADGVGADGVGADARAADPAVQALADRAAARGLPVYATDAATLARLADVATSQGVLATVRTDRVDPGALPAYLDRQGRRAPRLLALDGVQDPGNVGTLVRTAAWFGADAVVAGPGTASLYGPKTVRAGMGGHWDLALSRAPDLAATLGHLRHLGWAVYGADMEGTPVRAWTPRRPSVLVLGSEAHGLSPAVQACLDEPVALPRAPSAEPAGSETDGAGVESLNVAVAGGILLHAWLGGA
jgi:TrmH family RNA methyltransferase